MHKIINFVKRIFRKKKKVKCEYCKDAGFTTKQDAKTGILIVIPCQYCSKLKMTISEFSGEVKIKPLINPKENINNGEA